MEIGKNWGEVDPMQLQSFKELGQREQSAVRVALVGIRKWQVTKKEPEPMRVRITQDNTFNLKSFANTLHELGIGITDSMVRENDEVVIFQPKPYSKTFLPKNDEDRLAALEETLEEELSVLPKDLRDSMRKHSQSYT